MSGINVSEVATHHATNDPEACFPLHSSCKAAGYGLQRARYHHLGGRLCKSVACLHGPGQEGLKHIDATQNMFCP